MQNKKMIIGLIVALVVFFWVVAVPAQGLKKLQINDKYGTPDTSGDPITPKDNQDNNQDTTTSSSSAANDGMSYFNGTDVDVKEMINQISVLTGKQFIFDDKKIKGKITIIADKPMSKEMVYQAFLSSLEINGLTTVMTPAGLINIIDQKDALSKPIELFKADSPNTDRYITRIIQPVNISAKEIVEVISKMVSKNGNVMPYPTTNSIIITDTGSNIDHIMKLIYELDQEGPQEQLEMIPIIYADAKDVADKITQIFEKKDASASSSTTRRRVPSRGTSDMEDVQSISKIIADERTNSLLIMGTTRSIVKVRALIAQLDRAISGADGSIHVYRLKFAKAKDVATVLSTLVGESSSKSSSSKGKTAADAAKSSGSVTLEGGVKVTADETTNSLIVVSSPKDYSTLVHNVIEKLDIVRPQVYLEAVIMSLDVENKTTLGFSGLGGIINTLSSGNTLTGFGSLAPSSSTAISTIAAASGGFGGGVVSSQTIDFTSNGTTVSVPAISGIITALASDTNANVLSTPSIMTLDNEAAKIQVGQEVPVQSGTTVSTGVTTFNVTREDVGIILEITPQISENDTVRLKLKQEITSVFASDPNLGPTLNKKSVETAVLAKNKQTIVIGGLIDDKATVSTQKVPLLGDIPVLGTLFRNRITSKTKSNLIIFITPYIIRERRDYLSILKKKIEERNHFIDMNYGTSQQKFIRKAITDHANDLLEFRCNVPSDADPCWSSPPTAYQTNYNPKNSYQQAVTTSSNSSTPTRKVKNR